MEAPSHRDETILMVEDDELVRMSVQSLIESLGYRVVPARDGLDARSWRPRRGDCDRN
jgi:CheY-like chemotaxis protein